MAGLKVKSHKWVAAGSGWLLGHHCSSPLLTFIPAAQSWPHVHRGWLPGWLGSTIAMLLVGKGLSVGCKISTCKKVYVTVWTADEIKAWLYSIYMYSTKMREVLGNLSTTTEIFLETNFFSEGEAWGKSGGPWVINPIPRDGSVDQLVLTVLKSIRPF